MDRLQEYKNGIRFLVVILFVVSLGWGLGYSFNRFGFILNVTDSLPRGIYRTYKIDREIDYNDIVIVNINDDLKEALGKYIVNKNIKTIMKKVVGKEGDIFNYFNYKNVKYINRNGITLGMVLNKDSKGNLVKHNGECRLKKDEYYLMGTHILSFDSRYFGSINRKEILYFAKPILVFE